MEFKFGNEKIRNIVCSYIFGVVLFQTLGQTRNPEFRPEFPVANFPEHFQWQIFRNRTGIPENSIFRRRISNYPDIRLNPNSLHTK